MATSGEKANITAGDVRALLHEKFSDTRQYAYAEEVGNSTGAQQRRRLDMVVVDCFASHCFAIEGIEVKISKSDLRRELQDSSKHNIFYENLDYYSLAAPASVVDIDLIPKHWGLYLVHEGKNGLFLRTHRKPCSLHDAYIGAVDKGFIAALLRAMWGSRPSDSMVEAARKEGYEKALDEAGVTDYKQRIEYLQKECEAGNELRRRLSIWGGAYGVEKAISDFEAFQNLDTAKLVRVLERIVDNSQDVKRALKLLRGGGDGEKCAEPLLSNTGGASGGE